MLSRKKSKNEASKPAEIHGKYVKKETSPLLRSKLIYNYVVSCRLADSLGDVASVIYQWIWIDHCPIFSVIASICTINDMHELEIKNLYSLATLPIRKF